MTADRVAILRSGIEPQMLGIEIGPSYSPLFPKAEGWNVIIVDHASQAELVAKYAQWGVETSRIEPVDVVLNGDTPIEQALADRQGQIDYIVASHVFEHLPNPIAFLQSASQLLRPGGILKLAIPDKRFCFDLLRPVSSAGQLVQAYAEDRRKHSLGQYFDAIALQTLKDGSLAFPGASGTSGLGLQTNPAEGYQQANQAFHSSVYVDIHAWVFTPSSFSAIMRMLVASGLVTLNLAEIESDQVYEFFVTLAKPVLPPQANAVDASASEGIRDDLLRVMQEEVAVRFP